MLGLLSFHPEHEQTQNSGQKLRHLIITAVILLQLVFAEVRGTHLSETSSAPWLGAIGLAMIVIAFTTKRPVLGRIVLSICLGATTLIGHHAYATAHELRFFYFTSTTLLLFYTDWRLILIAALPTLAFDGRSLLMTSQIGLLSVDDSISQYAMCWIQAILCVGISAFTRSASIKIWKQEKALQSQLTRSMETQGALELRTRELLDTQRRLELDIERRIAVQQELRLHAIELVRAHRLGERQSHALKRQAEQLEQARGEAVALANARTDFLARMSHELRTPLSALAGLCMLAQDENSPLEQRRLLSAINSTSSNLTGLVNDILDHSKLGAGKLALDVQEFDIVDLVQDCVALIGDEVYRKGISLQVEIDHAIPATIKADRLRILQILSNLLSNAAKFTNEGTITLWAKTSRAKDGTTLFKFGVRDTGIGVPKSKQKEIFDPFAQADSSTTRKYGGTGLGLSISAQLIELMKGGIKLKSADGAGSEFWCWCPAEASSQPRWPKAPRSGRHAILIGHPQSVEAHIVKHLKRAGFETLTLHGLDELLPHLTSLRGESEIVTLVNYAILAYDTELDNIVSNTPHSVRSILLVPPQVHFHAEQNGFDALLPNPFTPDALLQAVEGRSVADAPSQREKGSFDRGWATGYSLLLVEDHPVNSMVGRKILEQCGFAVTTVQDGRLALKALKKQTFDVILMDCQMPEMDGYETTRRIRAHSNPLVAKTPIIALTAHAIDGERDRCLEAGMDEFMTKPLQPDRVQTALMGLLGPRRAA